MRCSEKLGGNGVLPESFVEVEVAEEEPVEKTNRLGRSRRSVALAVAEGGGEGRERELRGDQRKLCG